MSRVLPPYPPYSGTAAMVVSTLVWATLPPPLVLAQSITPATDGTGTQVVPNGSVYDITGGTQSGDGANLFHSFQQFGLTPAEVANFIADPAVQNILGRVTGGNVSVIDGLLQVSGSDANLYLINPAGILFGPNAVLNLDGSFTATSASAVGFGENWLQAIGDADYARLTGNPTGLAFGDNAAALINAGNLAVPSGETLALVGGSVINTGTLTAPGGQIVVMAVPGENLVRITPEGARLSLELATLPEAALPETSSGLTPLDIPSLLRAGGEDVATGLTVNEDGTVSLTGSERPLPTTPGSTIASGNIDASGATGGTVYILGELVGVVDAGVDASGDAEGGTILVGGDYQGQGPVPNARRTYVDSASEITADALTSDNGGQIIVWSDLATQAYGSFNAKGGTASGDGGFVEISSLEFLDFAGSVNLSAPQGRIGTLLIDPTNIEIVAGAGNSGLADNDNFADPDIGSFNTISNTVIDSATANVILQATNNIIFSAPITISQGNVGLTAQAGNSIDVISTITTNGGDITLSGDADGNGEGRVIVLGGLTTNGGLIDIAGASSGSFGIYTDAPIDSGGGAITFTGTSESVSGINIFGSITSQGGDISFTGTNSGVPETLFPFLSGIYADAPIDSGGGAITFTGTSESSSGIAIFPNSTITSQGGDIAFSGTGLTGSGISVSSNVSSGSGNISFTGTSTGSSGIETFAPIDSRGGAITFTGTGIKNNGIFTSAPIDSGSGDFTIISDNPGIASPLSGTGNLHIQPLSTNFDFALGGTGTFLDATELAQIANGFATVTIGSSDITGDITLAGDVTFSNTFSATLETGGSINTSGLTLAGTGTTGLTLVAGNGVTTSAVNTEGQGISIIGDADGDGEGPVAISGNMASNGGLISVSGSGSTQPGILASYSFDSQTGEEVSINSGGGNISLFGTSERNDGIQNGLTITSEGGDIFLTGTSNSAVGLNLAHNFSRVDSQGGDITFNGNAELGEGIVVGGIGVGGGSGGNITFEGNSIANTGILLLTGVGSGSGDISLRGSSTEDVGVLIAPARLISLFPPVDTSFQRNGFIESGAGDITIAGTSINDVGISLLGSISSEEGNITLTGTSTARAGILSGDRNSLTLSRDYGGPLVTLVNGLGIDPFLSTPIAPSIFAQEGDITFIGNSVEGTGITLQMPVTSTDGTITLNGSSAVSEGILSGEFNENIAGTIDSQRGDIVLVGTSEDSSGIFLEEPVTSVGGNITFTGSTRDIDGIWATAPINSGGGNISFTGSSTGFHGIHFRSLDSQGGAITLVGNSDLSEGIFGEGPMGSGGGTVDLTANRSSVDIQDITTTGGDINIQAETFIFANTLDSSNNSPGGNISLEAPGGIQVNSINTQGSTTGGAITVNTGGKFQALGSFVDRAGVLASLSSWGGTSGGPITLIYGPLDFTLGDASGNGTQAAIHSKDVTLANASFSGSQIFGAGTPGRVILNVPSGGGGNEGGFPNEGTFLPPDPQRPEAPPQRTPQNALTSIEGGSLNDQQPLPEQEAHDQFANYFGDTLRPAQDVSIGESQATLRSIQSQTGEVPAFLYVRFNSEVNARLDDGKDPAAPILELLLITPDDDPKRVQVLHINRQDILATQEKLRRQITNPNLTRSTAYLEASQQLYNWIIAPIQPDLEAAGVTNIGFIMDSGLRTLPLAALHDGEQFLVERYSLGLIPSVGLIDTEYVNLNRQTSSLVVAGSAEFINQPALWAANLEMQTIHDFWTGSALTGADFTVAGLQKTRQQAGIIHMATHAEFLRGAPSNSYLQFFDRRLRLSEVPEMGWYAPQVELVTLSACQTAMGNLDAELGFAGFALQAGAKSALASLWKVSDEATAGLMVTFYQQLDRQATKAETLRQAQLAMIRGEVYTEGGQLILPNQTLPLPPQLMTDSLQIFSHPFYWAAFTMVGSPW
jgi:filamentous hemagglutinin family protein